MICERCYHYKGCKQKPTPEGRCNDYLKDGRIDLDDKSISIRWTHLPSTTTPLRSFLRTCTKSNRNKMSSGRDFLTSVFPACPVYP